MITEEDARQAVIKIRESGKYNDYRRGFLTVIKIRESHRL